MCEGSHKLIFSVCDAEGAIEDVLFALLEGQDRIYVGFTHQRRLRTDTSGGLLFVDSLIVSLSVGLQCLHLFIEKFLIAFWVVSIS
jgi:hypothetical protein